MAKRRATATAALKDYGFTGSNLMTIAGVVGGLVLGAQIKKMVQKKDLSGTDLLGLDGEASKWAAPALTTAAGIAASTMVSGKLAKNLALGVAVAGGAGLVNAALGQDVATLGNDEDASPLLVPGIGSEDDGIRYDELPDNNQSMTTYNPDINNIGTVSDVDMEEDYVSGVDDLL